MEPLRFSHTHLNIFTIHELSNGISCMQDTIARATRYGILYTLAALYHLCFGLSSYYLINKQVQNNFKMRSEAWVKNQIIINVFLKSS